MINDTGRNPYVIVGAGVSGCVLGHELSAAGKPVVVIEREPCVGGLARSFSYGGFTFDVGPHRFFTCEQAVNGFIRDVLGESSRMIMRDSAVYFSGRYYPWPLKLSAMLGLPAGIALGAALDLVVTARRRLPRPDRDFEGYILDRYGPTLYRAFFKGYTSKFLGLEPSETHFAWAREGMKRSIIDDRYRADSLGGVFRSFLSGRQPRTTFIYPDRGMGSFCEKLAGRITEQGGHIYCNAEPDSVVCSAGRIERISFRGMSIEPRQVIWTGSVNDLQNLLHFPETGLSYLSLILYNITLKRPADRAFQWCYFGDEKISFSRVSRPLSFSRAMAPRIQDSIQVEVTCRMNDQRWHDPRRLVETIVRDLLKARYIRRRADIGDIYIEKAADAYPVYTLDYDQRAVRLRDSVRMIRNLALCGRTALFWYNNMDDSIADALDMARRILAVEEIPLHA